MCEVHRRYLVLFKSTCASKARAHQKHVRTHTGTHTGTRTGTHRYTHITQSAETFFLWGIWKWCVVGIVMLPYAVERGHTPNSKHTTTKHTTTPQANQPERNSFRPHGVSALALAASLVRSVSSVPGFAAAPWALGQHRVSTGSAQGQHRVGISCHRRFSIGQHRAGTGSS